jgi:hypothetical protein
MLPLRSTVGVLLAILCLASAGCQRSAEPGPGKATDPRSTTETEIEKKSVSGDRQDSRPAVEKKRPVREAPPPPQDLSPLHLEVTALEMLYQFQFTRPQLEQLAKLAPKTASEMPRPRLIEASDDYVKALKALHAALVENEDDQIAEASAAMEKERAAESPDFDEVEITPAARKGVPELLARLSDRQIISYVKDYAEEFPDPREKLLFALDRLRGERGREWEEVRDEVAGQVGWLLAGLDTTAEEKVVRDITQLLNRAHAMSDDELKAARPELEKAIDAIVGRARPMEVLRHFVERSLAELLSSPRLVEALKLRLEDE